MLWLWNLDLSDIVIMIVKSWLSWYKGYEFSHCILYFIHPTHIGRFLVWKKKKKKKQRNYLWWYPFAQVLPWVKNTREEAKSCHMDCIKVESFINSQLRLDNQYKQAMFKIIVMAFSFQNCPDMNVDPGQRICSYLHKHPEQLIA